MPTIAGVPSTVAESVLNPSEVKPPASGTRRARVLYDYEAADSSELALLADEVGTLAVPRLSPGCPCPSRLFLGTGVLQAALSLCLWAVPILLLLQPVPSAFWLAPAGPCLLQERGRSCWLEAALSMWRRRETWALAEASVGTWEGWQGSTVPPYM